MAHCWACREANYPFSIDDLLQDSVVVHFSALPGQGYYGYNLGMTLTHETGCVSATCVRVAALARFIQTGVWPQSILRCASCADLRLVI